MLMLKPVVQQARLLALWQVGGARASTSPRISRSMSRSAEGAAATRLGAKRPTASATAPEKNRMLTMTVPDNECEDETKLVQERVCGGSEKSEELLACPECDAR